MSTAVTTGSWPATTAGSSATGLNTEHVTWGQTSGNKSGYMFRGGTVDVKLDGSEFTLGTFTHENFPISMPTQEFDVDLRVNVAFEDGTTSAFSFRFHHNETPNVGSSPEDLVDLPTFISPETVMVDGEQYKVLISGFKQNGAIVRQFVSPENGSNSADVVALFTRPGKPDVVLTHVEFKGDVKRTQSDEHVEILNRGTEPADISGWVLGADDAGQDFTFPPGTILQPGERIRVYTNEIHPDWGSFSYGINRAIWNDRGDVARLRDSNGNAVSELPYGSKVPVATP
jgi:lamin tail-like protein